VARLNFRNFNCLPFRSKKSSQNQPECQSQWCDNCVKKDREKQILLRDWIHHFLFHPLQKRNQGILSREILQPLDFLPLKTRLLRGLDFLHPLHSNQLRLSEHEPVGASSGCYLCKTCIRDLGKIRWQKMSSNSAKKSLGLLAILPIDKHEAARFSYCLCRSP
jgi:hypothetical protein